MIILLFICLLALNIIVISEKWWYCECWALKSLANHVYDSTHVCSQFSTHAVYVSHTCFKPISNNHLQKSLLLRPTFLPIFYLVLHIQKNWRNRDGTNTFSSTIHFIVVSEFWANSSVRHIHPLIYTHNDLRCVWSFLISANHYLIKNIKIEIQMSFKINEVMWIFRILTHLTVFFQWKVTF